MSQGDEKTERFPDRCNAEVFENIASNIKRGVPEKVQRLRRDYPGPLAADQQAALCAELAGLFSSYVHPLHAEAMETEFKRVVWDVIIKPATATAAASSTGAAGTSSTGAATAMVFAPTATALIKQFLHIVREKVVREELHDTLQRLRTARMAELQADENPADLYVRLQPAFKFLVTQGNATASSLMETYQQSVTNMHNKCVLGEADRVTFRRELEACVVKYMIPWEQAALRSGNLSHMAESLSTAAQNLYMGLLRR